MHVVVFKALSLSFVIPAIMVLINVPSKIEIEFLHTYRLTYEREVFLCYITAVMSNTKQSDKV